jgi:hypothetical protein
MRRLTDPAHERAVFNWNRRNPPPKSADKSTDGGDVKLHLDVTLTTSSAATVRIEFEGLRDVRHAPLQLRLAWQDRDGAWLFQPAPNAAANSVANAKLRPK